MRKPLLYKRVITVLFLLLLVAISFAQNGSIKGIVKGAPEPLSSATVSIGNKTELTNDTGEFFISLSTGTYILIITHIGYKKIKQPVSIDAGKVQSLEFNLTKDELMGEEVRLGSRSTVQRSNLNTPVPIDVFLTNKLIQTGQSSLTQMLNFAVPSFNASRQLLNEPVTLRGLDPDHVLIFVNGTRYHNTVWLNNGVLPGQLGRGSVGNDINSIPFSSIEKVEILRDGASAQYGSDAIAGVINIRLKELTDKTFIQLHAGQFYEGDGLRFSFGFNRGIHLNKKGFLDYSADFRYQAPTFRGGYYEGTVYYPIPVNATPAQSDIIRALDDQKILERGFNRKDAVSNVGIVEFFSSGFLINGGYSIGNHTELYWTGGVNYHKNIYNAVYRYPKNQNQVNLALYPDGFKARVESANWDISGIAGVKGETKNRWHWEFSNAYGNNTSINNVSNTNNSSQQFTLGKKAPTAFYLGELKYNQLSNNISFSKDLVKKSGGIKSMNLGFGAELRFENYQKKEGEEASWKNYDPSGFTQGSSQGSPGFNPDNNVNENRNVAGTYIDLEAEINDHFLFDLAARYEYYNDFGGNLAGKLAARYKFSEKFSLRGSVSNGFRAPSMQQLFSGGTSTVFANAGPGGIRAPVIQGTFSNTSEIAKVFGVPALQAERSVNVNGGFTSKLSQHISLTADAYWIQIKNRVVLSGVFRKTNNPDVVRVLANYKDIDQVQFYANAINTRTHGIDIILNGNWNINKANLGLTLAANFNRNHIFGEIKTTDSLPSNSLNKNSLFGIVERTNLEKGQPDSKIILTSTFNKGKFGLVFRNTRFGSTARTNLVINPTDTLYEFFSQKILTDISINYTPKTLLTITAGANNIFDVYPDRLKNYGNTSEGIFIYSNDASPFGFNGGYYYLSVSFNF